MMKKPEVVIIAALAESNRVIGRAGKIPWHLPEDLRRFQRLTLHHTVVMGRKTWEFDLEQRPLPHRRNIILSRTLPAPVFSPNSDTLSQNSTELLYCQSWEQVWEHSQTVKKIFVMGGATLYNQALAWADTLELTFVAGDFDGDVFFPDYRPLLKDQFAIAAEEQYSGFRCATYHRIG